VTGPAFNFAAEHFCAIWEPILERE